MCIIMSPVVASHFDDDDYDDADDDVWQANISFVHNV